MEWSSEAEQALKEVPFFVRPAVRKKIESIANAAGINVIAADVYAETRAQFTRRPRLPLLTALSTLVAATVLARPTALVTFGLIALAGTLNSKRHPQGRIMR